MPFTKGHKLATGRPKGTPNKISSIVRENVVAVFAGIGGLPTMIDWASQNKSEYYKIYSKLLPTDIESSDGSVVVNIVKFTDD